MRRTHDYVTVLLTAKPHRGWDVAALADDVLQRYPLESVLAEDARAEAAEMFPQHRVIVPRLGETP